MKAKFLLMVSLLSCASFGFFACKQPANGVPSQLEKTDETEFVTLASEGQAFSFFIRYNKGKKPVKISDAGYLDLQKTLAVCSGRNAVPAQESEYENVYEGTDLADFNLPGNPLLEQRNQKVFEAIREYRKNYREATPVEPQLVEMNTTSYVKGETRDWWLTKTFASNEYEKRSFTLKEIGDHCLIWYEDGITGVDAITDDSKFTIMKDAFDTIYAVETDLFGKAQDFIVKNPNEYITKIDDKIHIAIMDPKNDRIGGFFSSADFARQSILDTLALQDPLYAGVKSNEAQILYLNY